ncbi:siderophore ABC transporter substrate-binding protein [Isoptericola haloaureus]|uniref:Siderophore ABC transporter substrate-binding protein n=1 Tax=Isoptericola haloaureus TaxID=1542902 RepID=A0ABU7Z6K7_9MICO
MSIRSLRRAAVVAAPAAVLALSLSACADTDETEAGAAEADTAAGATTLTIEHAQGTTELDGVPEKIFTFDYAALAVLDALDVDVAGVAKSNLPDVFSEYAGDDVTDIGTIFEPDYETVAAEQPDLIIVAGRSSTAYPDLSEIAPTIDLSNDWSTFHESVVANTELLGQAVGAEEGVDELVADLDESVAAAQEVAADAGTGLIVLTSGGEVTAYGPGSRFGYLHDALGVTPAVEDVEAETHGEAVSFEFVLEADPDWLFVLDRDAAIGEGTDNAEQVLDNAVVHETTAWSEDQVVYLDPVAWYIVNGGVPTLTGMADEVTAALQDAS